jgi:hypothetical protein
MHNFIRGNKWKPSCSLDLHRIGDDINNCGKTHQRSSFREHPTAERSIGDSPVRTGSSINSSVQKYPRQRNQDQQDSTNSNDPRHRGPTAAMLRYNHSSRRYRPGDAARNENVVRERQVRFGEESGSQPPLDSGLWGLGISSILPSCFIKDRPMARSSLTRP